MEKSQQIVTLEDILVRFNNQTKKFIEEIDKEDNIDRVESLDAIVNDIKAQKMQTSLYKNKFINEIKSGLGEKIKSEPTTIVKHSKPWYNNINKWVKSIFTKF
jgi:uncharacterized protein Yka (UPF0111/DUF47 family)